REGEPLAPYTWFRLGGEARYFAEPTTLEELSALVKRCHEAEIPVRLLGGGSNVLAPTAGVPGVVIHLAAPAFGPIQVMDGGVTAGAGAKLGHVITAAVREGLGGLEQLTGVPGPVGGALRGNACTHGGAIGQWTTAVTVMSRKGEIATRARDDLQFGYGQSNLDDAIVLDARFELEPEDSAELTKRMQRLWIVKQASQPIGGQHASCIFKDPAGGSAAKLIEDAGLKGARQGKAEVSDRNANFIEVEPGATSDDVERLIDHLREQVARRLGVQLEVAIDIW
ncbi:MAG: UDP-N-acetylmuramate dehydrogenase, partial [Planctomycetes bacterium]|nr:UDP-N-acetylmuramate dehydrogenase [Planctomycetota bacterium]